MVNFFVSKDAIHRNSLRPDAGALFFPLVIPVASVVSVAQPPIAEASAPMVVELRPLSGWKVRSLRLQPFETAKPGASDPQA